MKNNLTVKGNLVSAGPATMKKSLIVEGGLTTQAPVTMKKSLTVEGTLTAPGIVTGTVMNRRNTTSAIHQACTPTGTGRCSAIHEPSCAAGNKMVEGFKMYCDVYPMGKGYCFLYTCISVTK